MSLNPNPNPSRDQNQTALVIGGGAVGTALSWQLSLRGAQVSVYGRSGPRTQPIPFVKYGGAKASINLSELTNFEASFVAIAVKAYDLEMVLKDWMPRLDGVPCVVFCNGYWENIVKPFDLQRGSILRWGVCTLGVRSSESGIYQQTSEVGSFTFGPPDLSNSAESLPSLFEQELTNTAYGGVRMQWVPAMRWIVRKKWLFNTVINTLCARDQLQSRL